MNCIRCGKPIGKAAFLIPATKGGPLAFGPVCARKAGLVEKPTKPMPLFSRLPAKAHPPEHDPNQIQLEFV